MTLTKADLIESLRSKHGLTRKLSKDCVEFTIDNMIDTLSSGENILIYGFGKFCVREKMGHKGRNFGTDEEMILRSRRVVTFRCGKNLKIAMNRT